MNAQQAELLTRVPPGQTVAGAASAPAARATNAVDNANAIEIYEMRSGVGVLVREVDILWMRLLK